MEWTVLEDTKITSFMIFSLWLGAYDLYRYNFRKSFDGSSYLVYFYLTVRMSCNDFTDAFWFRRWLLASEQGVCTRQERIAKLFLSPGPSGHFPARANSAQRAGPGAQRPVPVRVATPGQTFSTERSSVEHPRPGDRVLRQSVSPSGLVYGHEDDQFVVSIMWQLGTPFLISKVQFTLGWR